MGNRSNNNYYNNNNNGNNTELDKDNYDINNNENNDNNDNSEKNKNSNGQNWISWSTSNKALWCPDSNVLSMFYRKQLHWISSSWNIWIEF